MELRAAEDTATAEDLTPPLPPLAFCLHRPFIATHCSACSLPLPPNPIHLNSLLYCSAHHSSLHSDQNLHHSSAARLAALLLRNHRTGSADPTRIGGLLTNHAKIIARGDDDEVLQMVKEEGAVIRVSPGNLAEALMCLVLTNAVEVLDEKGTNVGIAVYDWTFSWINHNCSPNACYRFTAMADDDDRDGDSRLRIYPAMVDGGGAATSDLKRSEWFGPRIIVRSIMGIRKHEEVTIAYTDLLQPKGLRQSELLLNHQFNCYCKRCRATPAAYVDRNLQAIYICSPNGTELISDDDFYKTTEAQKLTDAFDEAVDEYLQLNNPENCCIKLDELLTHGYRTSQSFIRLHQFHHLSLNACTTLASAYRVRASDLMVNSASESYDMSRASAAYSLLLAVFTHHLFRAEPSLIASAANHWKIAGESLICLSRKLQASSSGTSHECYQIFRQDGFDEKYFATEMLSEVSTQLLNCIVNLAGKVWSLLTDQQVCHLNEIKNLVDFRALLMVASPIPDDSGIEDAELVDVQIFHLGFHCLVFGMHLSGVCFGKQFADDTIVNTFHNNGVFPGERL